MIQFVLYIYLAKEAARARMYLYIINYHLVLVTDGLAKHQVFYLPATPILRPEAQLGKFLKGVAGIFTIGGMR